MPPISDPEPAAWPAPEPDISSPPAAWPAPEPGSWPAHHPGSGEPPRRPGHRRIVAFLTVLAVLVAPAVVGYELGRDRGATLGADGTTLGTGGPSGRPIDGLDGPTAGGGANSLDTAALVAAVDDVVVNVNTAVEGGGQAAGTGIIISSTGLALTNNHVIAGSTGLTVEFAATGLTRPAKVLGYSVVDDVALIQVQNVAGLTAATIGSSGSLTVGDPLVALGNAGGRGGTPTVVTGRVTALEQEITASD
ncbi:MAG: S1C family serine protease, partial [Actinomycetota bacterium]